jgi:methionine-rich copper-binding protein CopC
MTRTRRTVATITGIVSALTLATAVGTGMHRHAFAAETTLHLRLTRSEPAKDDSISAAPTALKLYFSQKPELSVTGVKLIAGAGKEVELSAPRLEGEKQTIVVVDVKGTVAPGKLNIAWRTSSGDGHIIKGDIPFSLRASASDER